MSCSELFESKGGVGASGSRHLQRILEEEWSNGEKEEESFHEKQRSLDTNKWVDQIVKLTPDRLPMIVTSSAGQRLMRLIVREMFTPDMDECLGVWDGMFLSRICAEENEGILEEKNRTGNAGVDLRCSRLTASPFNQLFLELILSSLTPAAYLKHCEVMSFRVGDESKDHEGGKVKYELFPLAAGGTVDSAVWVLRGGTRQTSFQTVISSNVYFSDASRETLSARLCQQLELESVKTYLQGRLNLLVEVLDPHFSNIDEAAFFAAIEAVWLKPFPQRNLLLLPVDITNVFPVLLLAQLLALNVPYLRDTMKIAVVAPTASFLPTTLRLLIDAMNPEVRDIFIRDKVHLVASLLEGSTLQPNGSKEGLDMSASTLYFDSIALFETFMDVVKSNKNDNEKRRNILVVSFPANIHKGWSKLIFDLFVKNNSQAAVLPSSRLAPMQPSKFSTSTDLPNLADKWKQRVETVRESIRERMRRYSREGRDRSVDIDATGLVRHAPSSKLVSHRPILNEIGGFGMSRRSERLVIRKELDRFFQDGSQTGSFMTAFPLSKSFGKCHGQKDSPSDKRYNAFETTDNLGLLFDDTVFSPGFTSLESRGVVESLFELTRIPSGLEEDNLGDNACGEHDGDCANDSGSGPEKGHLFLNTLYKAPIRKTAIENQMGMDIEGGSPHPSLGFRILENCLRPAQVFSDFGDIVVEEQMGMVSTDLSEVTAIIGNFESLETMLSREYPNCSKTSSRPLMLRVRISSVEEEDVGELRESAVTSEDPKLNLVRKSLSETESSNDMNDSVSFENKSNNSLLLNLFQSISNVLKEKEIGHEEPPLPPPLGLETSASIGKSAVPDSAASIIRATLPASSLLISKQGRLPVNKVSATSENEVTGDGGDAINEDTVYLKIPDDISDKPSKVLRPWDWNIVSELNAAQADLFSHCGEVLQSIPKIETKILDDQCVGSISVSGPLSLSYLLTMAHLTEDLNCKDGTPR